MFLAEKGLSYVCLGYLGKNSMLNVWEAGGRKHPQKGSHSKAPNSQRRTQNRACNVGQ